LNHSFSVQIDPFDFDLVRCVSSGQVFRWRLGAAGRWVGQDGGDAFAVEVRTDGQLIVESTTDEAAFRRLFRLDWDAAAMRTEILRRGPELAPYMEAIPGLRPVRPSSRTEAFVTFLCTPNNNLTRILPMAWNLGARGKQIAMFDGVPLFAFPSLAEVAEISDPELRAQGFGYRAKTIPEIAHETVRRGGEAYLDQLAQATYAEAMAELITIKGIGPKLADCISLFSLHHMEAAPIDTHLWQAVVRLYFPQWADEALTAKRYQEIGAILRDRFGDLTGWAHQYLFYDNVLNWRIRRSSSAPETASPRRAEGP
jgi:N-glycosylase/DNA lyase